MLKYHYEFVAQLSDHFAHFHSVIKYCCLFVFGASAVFPHLQPIFPIKTVIIYAYFSTRWCYSKARLSALKKKEKKSCSGISPEVLQQSVPAFLSGALTWSSGRWAHCCGLSGGSVGSADGRTVLLVGDQSMAWRRWSIAHGLSVLRSFTQLKFVSQPPLCRMSVCLQAPPR